MGWFLSATVQVLAVNCFTFGLKSHFPKYHRPSVQIIKSKVGLLSSFGLRSTIEISHLWELSTYRVENTQKSRSFKAVNNASKFRKRFQKNFEKVKKTTFFYPQNGQKLPLKTAKMSNLLIENLNFGVISQPLTLKI